MMIKTPKFLISMSFSVFWEWGQGPLNWENQRMNHSTWESWSVFKALKILKPCPKTLQNWIIFHINLGSLASEKPRKLWFSQENFDFLQ